MDNTKLEIINQWARDKIVETVVQNVASSAKNQQSFNLEDLIQDLYLVLLQKDDEYIKKLNEEYKGKKQIIYWLSRSACNAIFSDRSGYYLAYRKFQNKTTPIDGIQI